MEADLIDFVKSGRLGPIGPGALQSDILNVLGRPVHEGRGLTEIVWCYGSVEFILHGGLVDGIQLRFDEGLLNPATPLALAGPALHQLSCGEFERLLNEADVLFQLEHFDPAGEQIRILTRNSRLWIYTYFTCDPDRISSVAWYGREGAEISA